MNDTTRIAHAHGELFATQAFIYAMLKVLSPEQRAAFSKAFEEQSELARVHLMSAAVPEAMLHGFEDRCRGIGLVAAQQG